jgi:hypothetical protein
MIFHQFAQPKAPETIEMILISKIHKNFKVSENYNFNREGYFETNCSLN